MGGIGCDCSGATGYRVLVLVRASIPSFLISIPSVISIFIKHSLSWRLTANRCFNSRRRRRAGRAPMYGTGWLPYHNPPNYNPNVANPPKYGEPGYHPPPPYIPGQSTGTTFNSNEGYYGNHGGNGGQGIELQQPSSSYQPQRGGDPVYDAPAGPPPGKGHWGANETIIR